MSVSNGRVTNMGTVIAADGTGDLQKIFGTSQKSKAWFFTTAPINVFSKYKPVTLPAGITDVPGRLTEAQYRLANYGISINATNSFKMNGSWTYVPVTRWKRAHDFNGPTGVAYGYDHNEGQPIVSGTSNLYWNKLQSSASPIGGRIGFNYNGTNRGYANPNSRISVDELRVTPGGTDTLISNCHLVLALDSSHYEVNPNAISALSSDDQAIGAVIVPSGSFATYINNLADGTYTFYMFLVRSAGTLPTAESIPMPTPMSFNVTIDRKFWFNVTNVSVTIHRVQPETLIGTYDSSAIANWSSSTSIVNSMSNTTQVRVTYKFTASRKSSSSPTWTFSTMSLRSNGDLLATSGASITNAKVYNSGGTLVYNGNNAYTFPDNGTYTVELQALGTAKWLKDMLAMDTPDIPQVGFNCDPIFVINSGTFTPTPVLKGFRFRQI